MVNREKSKYYLIDNNPNFSEALKIYLECIMDGIVSGHSVHGAVVHFDPAIFYTDMILLHMDGEIFEGLRTAAQLFRMNHRFKILAIADNARSTCLNLLISSGLRGCVVRNSVCSELPGAIQKIKAGGYYFSNQISILPQA